MNASQNSDSVQTALTHATIDARNMPALSGDSWRVLDSAVVSEKINQYGNFIVCSCDRELTIQDKERLRLIAAAPDLLTALRDTLRSLNSLSCEVFDHRTSLSGLIDPRNASTIRAAYQAIAKAEGRA